MISTAVWNTLLLLTQFRKKCGLVRFRSERPICWEPYPPLRLKAEDRDSSGDLFHARLILKKTNLFSKHRRPIFG